MIGAFYKNRPFDLCRVNKFDRIQNLPFNFGLSCDRIVEGYFFRATRIFPLSRDRIIEEYFLEVKLYKNGLPDLCMYTKIL